MIITCPKCRKTFPIPKIPNGTSMSCPVCNRIFVFDEEQILADTGKSMMVRHLEQQVAKPEQPAKPVQSARQETPQRREEANNVQKEEMTYTEATLFAIANFTLMIMCPIFIAIICPMLWSEETWVLFAILLGGTFSLGITALFLFAAAHILRYQRTQVDLARKQQEASNRILRELEKKNDK